MTNEIDQNVENTEEIIEKTNENSVNYGNLEEKKKTGFFSMLSNLMTSDKKIAEANDKNLEKKQKSKKKKTDPNLFLFSDVVDEEVDHAKQSSENNEISEISDISEFSEENEDINEDIDIPSYLRKGSNQ